MMNEGIRGVCSLCGRQILKDEEYYSEKRLKFEPKEYREWKPWDFYEDLTCQYCLVAGLIEAHKIFKKMTGCGLGFD